MKKPNSLNVGIDGVNAQNDRIRKKTDSLGINITVAQNWYGFCLLRNGQAN